MNRNKIITYGIIILGILILLFYLERNIGKILGVEDVYTGPYNYIYFEHQEAVGPDLGKLRQLAEFLNNSGVVCDKSIEVITGVNPLANTANARVRSGFIIDDKYMSKLVKLPDMYKIDKLEKKIYMIVTGERHKIGPEKAIGFGYRYFQDNKKHGPVNVIRIIGKSNTYMLKESERKIKSGEQVRTIEL